MATRSIGSIFVDIRRKRNTSAQIKNLENQVSDITDVIGTLKNYSEELIRAVNKTDSYNIIDRENKRALAARYRKFLREPLIEYLWDTYKLPLDGENGVNVLLSSEDLNSFLKALNLTDKQMDALPGFAKLEYKDLKRRYGWL